MRTLGRHSSVPRNEQYLKRNAEAPDFRHYQIVQPLCIHNTHHIEENLEERNWLLSTTRSSDNELPNRVVVLNIIKSCGEEKSIRKVRWMHTDVLKKDLIMKDNHIATALITAYAKCGVVEEAQEIFDQILVHDVVSWSVLIAAYARNGFGTEALKVFRHMQTSGVCPDVVTYIYVLKACSIVESLEIGEDIEAEVTKRGFLPQNVQLGNALVEMYSKCGALDRAQEVFNQLPDHNVVSWNTLISGYARIGLPDEALRCFRQMGACSDIATYIYVLKACGIVGSLDLGGSIKAAIKRQGLLEKNVVLGTALVDMYCKCGALEQAQEVFEQLPERNVVTWGSLISGYVQCGLADEALKCFRKMKDAGVCPDAMIYTCILKACGIIGSLEVGEDVGAEVIAQRLFEKDVLLGNALLDMYSKCGAQEKAKEVFKQLTVRDVVSWNTIIGGYAQNGFADEALKCFRHMNDEGVHPDVVTYLCVLKACGITRSLEIGESVLDEIKKKGLLQKSTPELGNALVDMYCKCGALEKAREVFEWIPIRDVVSWNTLISGYIHHGLGDEALKCFKQMMNDRGICPDTVTYVCILKACGIVGRLQIGEVLDSKIRREGLLQKDVVLYTALMDMYFKCGAPKKAREVFRQLPKQNVVTWNVLIAGHAQLGQADMVLNLYNRMKVEDIMPNSVTFLVILNVCCHAGLVNDGEKLFDEMRVVFLLTPTVEHYTCMIDLFGRAGHFGKLQSFLEKFPFSSHLPLFQSILSSCRRWAEIKLGQWAFQQLVQMSEEYSATYVCMGNIYAETALQSKEYRA